MSDSPPGAPLRAGAGRGTVRFRCARTFRLAADPSLAALRPSRRRVPPRRLARPSRRRPVVFGPGHGLRRPRWVGAAGPTPSRAARPAASTRGCASRAGSASSCRPVTGATRSPTDGARVLTVDEIPVEASFLVFFFHGGRVQPYVLGGAGYTWAKPKGQGPNAGTSYSRGEPLHAPRGAPAWT